jgi:hypothetical protein
MTYFRWVRVRGQYRLLGTHLWVVSHVQTLQANRSQLQDY